MRPWPGPAPCARRDRHARRLLRPAPRRRRRRARDRGLRCAGALPAGIAVVPPRDRAGHPGRRRRDGRVRRRRAVPRRRGSCPMRRAILVNGIPASGKTGVSRAVADATGWPLLILDTVKEPFFDHLGTGDRAWNRALGRASSQAIWSVVADWPDPVGVVVDAWFGFEPREILEAHLARARIGATVEVWCHAPAEVIVEALPRPARLAASRPSRRRVHPGDRSARSPCSAAGPRSRALRRHDRAGGRAGAGTARDGGLRGLSVSRAEACRGRGRRRAPARDRTALSAGCCLRAACCGHPHSRWHR